MHSSKLTEIVAALDKKELERLSQFLGSTYFIQIKQKEKALLLFGILKRAHPEMKGAELEKQKVFTQLFPDSPYSANKMDKLMASLLKAIRQFILFEYSAVKDNELEQELTFLKFYRDKELQRSFEQSVLQVKKKQRAFDHKGKDYYFNQYRIESEITAQASWRNQRKGDLNLPNTLKGIDAFYLIAKLEYACWSLAQGISVNLEVESSLVLLDHLLRGLSKEYLHQYPLTSLYYYAYLLLRKGMDKEALDKLAELLEGVDQLIPIEQLKAIHAIYRSFLVKEYNKGEKKTSEIFKLYKAHLDAGYLYHDNGIFPGLLRNLVSLGLRSKSYDWVYQFLQKHQHRIIGTPVPAVIYALNLAEYYFALKKYPEVLNLLGDPSEDTYYKIAAKKLELKVLFETQDDMLETKMTAFKVYIHRNSKKKLPESPYQRNNNFINILRQINSPQVYKNSKKINKLIDKIELLGSVAEREWLLEKLEQMK